MFHDHERDLFDLNNILHRSGAQFMVVARRRRVGKTTCCSNGLAARQLPPCFSRSRRASGGSATHKKSCQTLSLIIRGVRSLNS